MRESEESKDHTADSFAARSHVIHEEILKLVLLIGVAIGGFFITRAIAANNREMSLRDAAEWYRRGEQELAAGDASSALDSFRRAAVKNRSEKRYVLALARALTSMRQDEAARNALLALREAAPEDPDINLQLARLAGDRLDVTEAVRYYHNVLYAPWPADRIDARRRVRVELIRFLLTHRQTNRALSELVALSTDLSGGAAVHVEVGQLFASAGDARHGLDQFQLALQRAPDSGAALAGAGQAAFEAGDYLLAQKYLRSAPLDRADVKETRELVTLILSNDPLATRIGSNARHQRLVDDLSYARKRLINCTDQSTDSLLGDVATLRAEIETFEKQLKHAAVDEDTTESGVELIDRVLRQGVLRCPPATPRDRALMLIARHHGVGQR